MKNIYAPISILLIVLGICSAYPIVNPSFVATTEFTTGLDGQNLISKYPFYVDGNSMINSDASKVYYRIRNSTGFYSEDGSLPVDNPNSVLYQGWLITAEHAVSSVVISFHESTNDGLVLRTSIELDSVLSMGVFAGGQIETSFAAHNGKDTKIYVLDPSLKTWIYNNTVNNCGHVIVGADNLAYDGKHMFSMLSQGLFYIWEFQTAYPTLLVIDSFDTGNSLLFYQADVLVARYNGKDTVVIADQTLTKEDGNGGLLIFTKTNGAWIQTETIHSVDAGVTSLGFLGNSAAFINENMFAATASADGFETGTRIGSCLVFTRNPISKKWEVLFKIVLPDETPVRYALGMGVNINLNGDILISAINLDTNHNGIIMASCHTLPVRDQVNCIGLDIDDCQETFGTTQLYKLFRPECGAVRVTENSTSLVYEPSSGYWVIDYGLTFTKDTSKDTYSCMTKYRCGKYATPQKSSNAVAIQIGAALLVICFLFSL